MKPSKRIGVPLGALAAAAAAGVLLGAFADARTPKVSLRLAASIWLAEPARQVWNLAAFSNGDEQRSGAERLAGILSYDLRAIAAGASPVPRLWFSSLPAAISATPEIERRKDMFLKIVLPLVLKVNEEIAADRERLLGCIRRQRAGQAPTAADRAWLAELAVSYETDAGNLDALLSRVDAIPPSLALAQAAKESGWGTSRFAFEGNALFGQWTFSANGHMVPQARARGTTHFVQAFPSLLDSARAYARNLNTHPAYREFRTLRAFLRHKGAALDSVLLASELLRYASHGPAYVNGIRRLIAVNRLREFDRSLLDAGRARPTDA